MPERSIAPTDRRTITQLFTGLLLALSSPSAIIWFASIGSSLIATRSGSTSPGELLWFFAGFFLAGVAWSVGLAAVIASSRRFLGRRFILGINLASAAVLAGLAVLSIYGGIREPIWAGARL